MIEVTQGAAPVILGLPHTGTIVPDDCAARLNATGTALADTDWNIHRLYDGLLDQVTTVRTPIHRYVIDANRSPGDESLYPGHNTTSLCPLTDFDGRPIYRAGRPAGCRRDRPPHRPLSCALSRRPRPGDRAGQGTAWVCRAL